MIPINEVDVEPLQGDEWVDAWYLRNTAGKHNHYFVALFYRPSGGSPYSKHTGEYFLGTARGSIARAGAVDKPVVRDWLVDDSTVKAIAIARKRVTAYAKKVIEDKVGKGYVVAWRLNTGHIPNNRRVWNETYKKKGCENYPWWWLRSFTETKKEKDPPLTTEEVSADLDDMLARMKSKKKPVAKSVHGRSGSKEEEKKGTLDGTVIIKRVGKFRKVKKSSCVASHRRRD